MKNQNSLELMKVPETDNYWLNKCVPTTNSFEELKEMLNDINDNIRIKKTIKSSIRWWSYQYIAALSITFSIAIRNRH